MRRLIPLFLTVFLFGALGACGAASTGASAVSPAPSASPAPSRPELTLPAPAEDWAARYVSFVDDNSDIFAALWPEGMAGAGFIDLDLDGTPELVLFDLGASASMGAQLFDLTEDGVVCVSSALEDAAGAFGEEDLTKLSVCASYFESFRLSRDGGDYFFWIDSANGTLESSWNELIRFGRDEEGRLTLESVCGRRLQGDAQTGVVVDEAYTVGGEPADAAAYVEAEAACLGAEDLGYDAKGVFVWTEDAETADGGLTALVRAASEVYAPLEVVFETEPFS